VRVVLNSIALVIHKCDDDGGGDGDDVVVDDDDDDDDCAWCRMCVKIPYSHNCCSLLIILSTKVHDYCFSSLYCQ